VGHRTAKSSQARTQVPPRPALALVPDPTMMTVLLVYAYCCGIYSSRPIAKECRERVDFMSIVGWMCRVLGEMARADEVLHRRGRNSRSSHGASDIVYQLWYGSRGCISPDAAFQLFFILDERYCYHIA
jgi:hypothetical protein